MVLTDIISGKINQNSQAYFISHQQLGLVMQGGLGPLEILILLLGFPIIYWGYRSLGNTKNHQEKLVITRLNHSTENSESVNDKEIDSEIVESNQEKANSSSENEKPTTIVQNITYNIHDRAISGDINNEIK